MVGVGLLRRKNCARYSALVLATIAMLLPVIGTLPGVYVVWVLTPPDVRTRFPMRGSGTENGALST